ncbi:TfoX/Sxy family protein [Roseibium sp. MMSF_3544]|uniref:TfoX/Sxy family protein n=1 Tax=unclassified Roseibium TaxID=2629323 RepID=UPI00273F499C|nr:TfoX/Sxy family protein [Roseibium sp. MMSF_3544]
MSNLMETVLVERTRALIPDTNVEQKRMFGGTCFMVNGNMLVCTSKNGLMARVGKEQEAAALAKPHASPCRPAGRPMPGFIRIEPEGIESDEDLRDWVEMARTYVCALPAKPKKAPSGRGAR